MGLLDLFRLLLFVGVAWSACPVYPLTQFSPSTVDLASLDGVVKQALLGLENAMSKWQIPSLAYAITLNKQSVAIGGFGVANLTSGAAATPDTLWRIGSLTKIVTVMAARRVVELNEQISLDSPVSMLEPRFSIFSPFLNAPTGALTLRQLGSHMAGLYDASPCDVDLGPNCTVDQVLSRVPGTQLMMPPGTKPQYSNFGFSLLGRSLERLVNVSYEAFTESQVLAPLGMTSSGFDFSPNVIARMAQGAGRRRVFVDASFSNPAGGMYSSARDMSAFMQHQISRLDELGPEFVAGDGMSATGLPWEMRRVNGYWSRTKIGNFDGFASSIELIPELGLGVCVLTNNADMDAHALTAPIVELLLPAVKSAINLGIPPASLPTPEIFFGKYTGQSALQVLSFDSSTGWLLVELEGAAGVLQPQAISLPLSVKFVFRSAALPHSVDSWSVENGCTKWMFNGLDGTQVIFERNNAQQQFVVRVVGRTDWASRLTKQ